MPKPALALLITGLILTTISPVLAHHFHYSDFLTGSLTGFGIGMELFAVILTVRHKRSAE